MSDAVGTDIQAANSAPADTASPAPAGGSASSLTQDHLDWTSKFCGMQIGPPGGDTAGSANATAGGAPGGILSGLADGAKSLWDKAAGAVEDGAKAIANEGGQLLNQVEDGAKKVGGAIEDGAKALWDEGGKFVDAVEDGAKKVGGEIEDGAKALWDEGGKVVDAAEDGAKKVGGEIEDGAKALWDEGGKVVDAVEDGAKKIGGAIEDGAKTLWDGAKDLVGVGPKSEKANAASKKITDMSEDDLKKMSFDDKKQMLEDLEGNGTPSGDARKAQMKLFRNTELDGDFKNKEADRADKVADQLKDDPDLKKATTDWGSRNDDQKVAALRKVLEAQSKQLGIPVPKIVVDHDPAEADGSITNGQYGDGVLHLNLDPASKVGRSFKTAIDTTVHEMSHAYQEDMVKRLDDGKIKPGDTEYKQAQMFKLNQGGNYIQPTEDYKSYHDQPEENHSRTTGPDYSEKIIKKLSVP